MAAASDCHHPVRFLSALWMLTCFTYLLHSQEGWPLFPALYLSSKLPWVVCGLAAGSIAMLFPGSPLALTSAGLVSLLVLAAWHSWIGAFQLLIPWCFFFLAAFCGQTREVRERAWFSSFLLGLAIGIAHCFNDSYLEGFEFADGSTLYQDFPFWLREFFVSHASAAAKLWLVAWLLPIALWIRGNRWGWFLFALLGAFSLVMYRASFYAFFLLIAAALLHDPRFLRQWKGGKERFVSPLQLAYLGMVLFFSWYIFHRWEPGFYVMSLGVCMTSLIGASHAEITFPRFEFPRSLRERLWLFVWGVYLSAPLFFSEIPPPFGNTQFSAREVRFPPKMEINFPSGVPSCEELQRRIALRWGYRWKPAHSACVLTVYHSGH